MSTGSTAIDAIVSDAPAIDQALHVRADLSEPDAPARLVESAVDELGGLDVLVNNVGYAVQARFEDVPDEEWDSLWQLTVLSYVRAIRAALPHLRDQIHSYRERVRSRSGAAPAPARAQAGKR